MKYTILEEKRIPNGMLIQIIRTNECGGRYYMVVDGEPGFHSLDYNRVKAYFDSITRVADEPTKRSR